MAYDLNLLRSKGQKYIFQLLIEAIENGELSISYTACAEFLEEKLKTGKIFSTHPGGVVGRLMDTLLEEDPELPLINMLVVDLKKGVPGDGADEYLSNRYGRRFRSTDVEDPRRLRLVAAETNDALGYKKWREIYEKHFGKLPKQRRPVSAEKDGQGDNPNYPKGGGESPEHKNLKEYILNHPEIVGVKNDEMEGKIEYSIPSGDRIDVIFLGGQSQHAVEVKSKRSNDEDLRRGLFQCVKYREVLKAQNGVLGKVMKVESVLVLERELPSGLQSIARRLKVKWFKVQIN